jgi:3-hydroxyisobutyrate dehydrogenase
MAGGADSAAHAATPSGVVAVLGLGAMGLPMAQHLVAGFRVRGFDVDAGRRTLLEQAGAASAADASAAAQGASVVLVAVRTLGQALECLFGLSGAAESLDDGAVVILTSTVGVEGAVDLEARLRSRGLQFVDAPVSGGAVRAGAGDLLVMASGRPAAVEAARPVLEALASALVVVGERAGDGQSMKVVNQLLCGVHIAAAAEALVLARALGIEPRAALEVLGGGAAQSFMLGDRGPRIAAQLAGEQPEVRSRLDIFVKDMGLVKDAAAAGGVELPVAAAALELYRLGEQRGLAAYDDSGVSLVI